MKTVGLFDAKTRLSELCREVAETGEVVVITRRGQEIARLIAPPRVSPLPPRTPGRLQGRIQIPDEALLAPLSPAVIDEWESSPLSPAHSVPPKP